jgi:hypothetical protein
MNTEIDERGRRFFNGIYDYKHKHPLASSIELDRYIEKQLRDIFGDTLPADQKHSLAAFGRAWRH